MTETEILMSDEFAAFSNAIADFKSQKQELEKKMKSIDESVAKFNTNWEEWKAGKLSES